MARPCFGAEAWKLATNWLLFQGYAFCSFCQNPPKFGKAVRLLTNLVHVYSAARSWILAVHKTLCPKNRRASESAAGWEVKMCFPWAAHFSMAFRGWWTLAQEAYTSVSALKTAGGGRWGGGNKRNYTVWMQRRRIGGQATWDQKPGFGWKGEGLWRWERWSRRTMSPGEELAKGKGRELGLERWGIREWGQEMRPELGGAGTGL